MSKKRRKSHKRTGRRHGASYWLERELRKKRFRRETHEAFEEAVGRASMYELRNMASGHGMAVDLGDVRYGVFWSRGWRGCEFGCGYKLDDWATPMEVSEERRDGVYIWRKGCKRKFNLTEE